ncbi:MAG: hypothetical protein II059_07585, partial [Clostridia bacterium]|nr:hypothetical protein [Clostridia bacterium]
FSAINPSIVISCSINLDQKHFVTNTLQKNTLPEHSLQAGPRFPSDTKGVRHQRNPLPVVTNDVYTRSEVLWRFY